MREKQSSKEGRSIFTYLFLSVLFHKLFYVSLSFSFNFLLSLSLLQLLFYFLLVFAIFFLLSLMWTFHFIRTKLLSHQQKIFFAVFSFFSSRQTSPSQTFNAPQTFASFLFMLPPSDNRPLFPADEEALEETHILKGPFFFFSQMA